MGKIRSYVECSEPLMHNSSHSEELIKLLQDKIKELAKGFECETSECETSECSVDRDVFKTQQIDNEFLSQKILELYKTICQGSENFVAELNKLFKDLTGGDVGHEEAFQTSQHFAEFILNSINELVSAKAHLEGDILYREDLLQDTLQAKLTCMNNKNNGEITNSTRLNIIQSIEKYKLALSDEAAKRECYINSLESFHTNYKKAGEKILHEKMNAVQKISDEENNIHSLKDKIIEQKDVLNCLYADKSNTIGLALEENENQIKNNILRRDSLVKNIRSLLVDFEHNQKEHFHLVSQQKRIYEDRQFVEQSYTELNRKLDEDQCSLKRSSSICRQEKELVEAIENKATSLNLSNSVLDQMEKLINVKNTNSSTERCLNKLLFLNLEDFQRRVLGDYKVLFKRFKDMAKQCDATRRAGGSVDDLTRQKEEMNCLKEKTLELNNEIRAMLERCREDGLLDTADVKIEKECEDLFPPSPEDEGPDDLLSLGMFCDVDQQTVTSELVELQSVEDSFVMLNT